MMQAVIPLATVTGDYATDPTPHWTWTVLVPAPTADNPDGMLGASRQFVPSAEMAEPTDDYLSLVAQEIASTFPVTTEEQPA